MQGRIYRLNKNCKVELLELKCKKIIIFINDPQMYNDVVVNQKCSSIIFCHLISLN